MRRDDLTYPQKERQTSLEKKMVQRQILSDGREIRNGRRSR